jgi:hypothetical protein
MTGIVDFTKAENVNDLLIIRYIIRKTELKEKINKYNFK